MEELSKSSPLFESISDPALHVRLTADYTGYRTKDSSSSVTIPRRFATRLPDFRRRKPDLFFVKDVRKTNPTATIWWEILIADVKFAVETETDNARAGNEREYDPLVAALNALPHCHATLITVVIGSKSTIITHDALQQIERIATFISGNASIKQQRPGIHLRTKHD